MLCSGKGHTALKRDSWPFKTDGGTSPVNLASDFVNFIKPQAL